MKREQLLHGLKVLPTSYATPEVVDLLVSLVKVSRGQGVGQTIHQQEQQATY